MSKNINTHFPTESIKEVRSKSTLSQSGENRKLFIEKKSTCSALVYSVDYDRIVNQNNSEKKADFLVVKNQKLSNSLEETLELYICELKGQDINGAFEQILATYNQIKPKLHLGVELYSVIVASKVPPAIAKAQPTKAKRDLLKVLKKETIIRNREHTITFV